MMIHTVRAGLPAKTATAFVLAAFFLSPFVAAQISNPSRVSDSILGVRIGMSSQDVQKKLDPLSVATGRPGYKDEDEDKERDEGGTKRAWSLKGTDFSSVALKINERGRVVWVTGFVRPSKEFLFSELGDTSLAVRATDSQAIWNVATPNGGYRLVAKGQNGRARVIYLFSLGQ
jgi:hypothetical protein